MLVGGSRLLLHPLSPDSYDPVIKLNFRDFQDFDIRLKDYQVIIFSWKKIRQKNLNASYMSKYVTARWSPFLV